MYDDTKLNNLIKINKTKCMARLKKDNTLQCKNNKKIGDFCKLHQNTSIQCRIDWNSNDIFENNFTNDISNLIYVDIEHIDIINRFSIKQLKNTIKHYRIKDEYKGKKELIIIIKSYLNKLKNYNNNLDKIILIQRTWKEYEKNKINKLRGEAFFNRKLCTNDNDFLTFIDCVDLNDDDFVSFCDLKGFHYGFHVKSLYQIIINDCINPYNREKIPIDELNRINKLFNILNFDRNNISINNLNSKEQTFQRIIDIFKMIDDLGYYTQVNWFLNLNISELKNYYIQAEDIWNYRAYELNSTIKKNIVSPDGICFNKLHKIQISTDIEVIRNYCLDEIEKLITKGKTDSDKKMGAMYSLSALVIVSYDAACSLPWLLDSVL